MSKTVPQEDRGRLKTGVAGVLGEGRGREEGGAGGSLRARRQPEATRCVLANTGIGCVLGEGRGDHCGAGHAATLLQGTQASRFKVSYGHVIASFTENQTHLPPNCRPSLEERVHCCRPVTSKECKGHMRGAAGNDACFHLTKTFVFISFFIVHQNEQ